MSEYREKNIRGEVVQLRRIADILEEILRMVKTDQERAQEARAHYKMEEEQSE